MFTVVIEIGLCGFGYDGGMVPDLRLGVLRVAWCRGSLLQGIGHFRDALKVKVRGVGA